MSSFLLFSICATYCTLSKSKVSLLGFHGYYTLALTLFQENYGAELPLFLKTLLSVYTAAEFVESPCRT